MSDESLTDEEVSGLLLHSRFRNAVKGAGEALKGAGADMRKSGHLAALARYLRSERELTPEMRNMLAELLTGEMARTRGKRRASYPELPRAVAAVDDLMEKRGMSRQEAIERASILTGIPTNTIENGVRRGKRTVKK